MARAKTEIADAGLRDDLVELIETVIIYKLPRLSREEIQAMLQVHDIRETRVYQEAKEEGFQEGIEKGIQEGIEKGIQEGIEKGKQEGIEKGIAKGLKEGMKKGMAKERQRILDEKLKSIPKLAARGLSAKEIADVLGLEVAVVRKALGKKA